MCVCVCVPETQAAPAAAGRTEMRRVGVVGKPTVAATRLRWRFPRSSNLNFTTVTPPDDGHYHHHHPKPPPSRPHYYIVVNNRPWGANGGTTRRGRGSGGGQTVHRHIYTYTHAHNVIRVYIRHAFAPPRKPSQNHMPSTSRQIGHVSQPCIRSRHTLWLFAYYIIYLVCPGV